MTAIRRPLRRCTVMRSRICLKRSAPPWPVARSRACVHHRKVCRLGCPMNFVNSRISNCQNGERSQQYDCHDDATTLDPMHVHDSLPLSKRFWSNGLICRHGTALPHRSDLQRRKNGQAGGRIRRHPPTDVFPTTDDRQARRLEVHCEFPRPPLFHVPGPQFLKHSPAARATNCE